MVPELEKQIAVIADEVETEIRETADLLAAVAAAQEVIALSNLYRDRFDLIRTAMIRRCLLGGHSFTEIATASGLSRQRVQQLAELPPATLADLQPSGSDGHNQ